MECTLVLQRIGHLWREWVNIDKSIMPAGDQMKAREGQPMIGRCVKTIPLLFLLLCACTPGEPHTPSHVSESGPDITQKPSSSVQQGRSDDLTSTSDQDQDASHTGPAVHCPEVDVAWVTDLPVYQTPSFSVPLARAPFLDPVFGTCIVRVTDRAKDPSPEDPSPGLKNEYSRVQSFNADGSLILVYGTEGTWYLYDVATLQPMRQIFIASEPRWDSNDPNILRFIDETRLMAYHVSEDEQRMLHDFAVDFPGRQLAAVWTRYEGSPSVDNRYWGLMAEDQDWLTIAYLVYDLYEDRIVSLRMLPEALEVDSVTISPLGAYFLAYLDEYCEQNQLGNDHSPCGLMVYDHDLREGRGLLRIVGHSDLALDATGNEVLVYQDIDTDHISMLDLASGEITPLRPIDFRYSPIGLHFSGRGYNLPGWVLVSTYCGAQPAATWMDDQIFALELRTEGRAVRFAHSHSLVDQNQEHDYWAEPHASVNPDFTRVLFTSNWGRSGSGEVEMYLIELPVDWPSKLP
jgi:hypothetical protein